MSSYETKRIFAENLTIQIARSGITQLDLANKMGVAASTVSSWCSGEKMPRMDKIEWMARYFDIPKSALIEAQQPAQDRNLIRIAARNGVYRERHLTDEQISALLAIIDQMPDLPDDL